MFNSKNFLAVAASAFCLVAWSAVGAAALPEVSVYAAASTTDAVNEIGALFEKEGKGKLVAAFASSSTLARQIEAGAPAQIFISADKKWGDYLDEKKLFEEGTRVDLLGNRLALIAAKDSKAEIKIEHGFPLAAALGDGRLAVGDPDHVPVGAYARTAFERLGVWKELEPKLARGESVRVALTYVERGESPFGVVYTTDAAVAPNVRIVGIFPEDTHDPIVYPMAAIKGNQTDASKAFYAFLKGPEARKIFEKYGFEVK